MVTFQRLTPADRFKFSQYFQCTPQKSCAYSFVNLIIWGRQRVNFGESYMSLFSQFNQVSVYPFPVGSGDAKPVLDAVIHDARMRGIPCRFTSMTAEDCKLLETLYPGQFHFHTDRDSFDYVYRIEDLATLKGKRYQSKRNFVNRFRAAHPDCETVVLNAGNLELVKTLTEQWYAQRITQDPLSDYDLEQTALRRALAHWDDLQLEGLALVENGQVLAITIGSRLCDCTFDVHFEKALDTTDGAYAAINQAFAAFLAEKYPELEYLNREDDMGLEGLRKAKLSYHPDHMVEKYWARLWEDEDED